MNKKLLGTIASVAAFVLIAGGILWGSFELRQSRAPQPATVDVRGVGEAPTPTPTPTEVPVVVVEEQPVVDEEPYVDPGPIRCPDGTQANSGDGGNDTSCLPVICFNIALPDPAHPECDYAYPPDYYR